MTVNPRIEKAFDWNFVAWAMLKKKKYYNIPCWLVKVN